MRHPFAIAPNRLRLAAMHHLRPLALRSLVAGFAAGVAMLAGAGWVAQAQGISGFNSNQPVNYSADRIELQDRQNRVVLSGSVDIKQGDRDISPRITFTSWGSSSILVARIRRPTRVIR